MSLLGGRTQLERIEVMQSVQQLTDMGFTPDQAESALTITQRNLPEAVNLLLAETASTAPVQANVKVAQLDAHMQTNPTSGSTTFGAAESAAKPTAQAEAEAARATTANATTHDSTAANALVPPSRAVRMPIPRARTAPALAPEPTPRLAPPLPPPPLPLPLD